MTDTPRPSKAELDAATWTISSYSSSGGGGNCVEVGRLNSGQIAVRHSRCADEGNLAFTRTQLAALVDACTDGTLDDLAI